MVTTVFNDKIKISNWFNNDFDNLIYLIIDKIKISNLYKFT